ncbi:hypothetical protein ABUW04_32220 [Streptacidiphilus sp. N1-10]|uniref:DivIVA domain-containing protein n=1 Tax=Streptacidiphilus jeojiensis TaxID=3229225 RepID=A0ABV6XXF8_9ACTN
MDEQGTQDAPTNPPVVVHPVQPHPMFGDRSARRVEVRHELVGYAFQRGDVEEFLRRAGLDDPDVADPDLVRWMGGGIEVW